MKKYKEDTMTLVGTGVTMGVGNTVLGALPGGAGTSMIAGINKGATMMGPLAVASGGTATMRMMNGMMPKQKKNKKGGY